MKALMHDQMPETTETGSVAPESAAPSNATDVGVSHVCAGIAEVLTMRVGCWQAPVHLLTEPTAA